MPFQTLLDSLPVSKRLSVFLFGLLLATGLFAQIEAVGPSTIESLELIESEAGLELKLVSSDALRLVGVEANPEGYLVLQLPRHAPGPGVEDLLPSTGWVSSVRLQTQPTSQGTLTRVVVSTREPVAHSLSTEASVIRLRIWPAGAENPEAPLIARLQRQVQQLEVALEESEEVRTSLAQRSESLERRNQSLAERFKALEARRGELDGAMKATLGEATELLRSLGSRNQELNQQLRQAESRERELEGRLREIGDSWTASETARQQLASRLETVLEASSVLARKVNSQKAREQELEAALASSRKEIERLAEQDSDLARELGERLAAATAREDELRSQLVALQETLVESRNLESLEPEVEAEATWTRVDTGDGYEGWVLGEKPAVDEDREAQPESASVVEPSIPALDPDLPPASPDVIERLTELLQEQEQLGARLDALEASRGGVAEGEVEGEIRGKTTGSLNLRSGADRSAAVLAVLPPGTSARVLGRQSYWLRVRTDAGEGWISSRFFQLESESSAASGATLDPATASEQARVSARFAALESDRQELEIALEATTYGERGRVTARLNLRPGPGFSFQPLKVLTPDSIAIILHRGETWHRVRVGVDAGWIHGQYLVAEEYVSSD